MWEEREKTRDIINNPYYYIKGGKERGKRLRKEGLITRKDEAAVQLFFFLTKPFFCWSLEIC